MSSRHFSFLLVLTLAVALLVLLIPGRTGKESGFEQTRLLPGLQAQVNDLDRVQFTGAGGTVVATLRRSEDAWRVDEADGYRADWERLRTLLADLARAEIVEPKTANPEYYDRLGVEDVSRPDAGGTQIGFPEGSGLPAVIVGKRAQGRSGQYVRLEGAAESALIDRELDLPSNASDWLEQGIVDIPDTEVVEVEILHPDGERVVARKASADDPDFVLQNIPEGREIRSAWTVNSLAGGLSSLALEAVAREDTVDWTAAVRFGLVTADGLRVDAELVSVEAPEGSESAEDDADSPAGQRPSGQWVRLQASPYRTAAEGADRARDDTGEAQAEDQAREPSGDQAGDQAGDQVGDQVGDQAGNQDADELSAEDLADGTTPDDPAERARQINERVSGWAYRIPQYKYDSMIKRMEDLLKAVEEPDA